MTHKGRLPHVAEAVAPPLRVVVLPVVPRPLLQGLLLRLFVLLVLTLRPLPRRWTGGGRGGAQGSVGLGASATGIPRWLLRWLARRPANC